MKKRLVGGRVSTKNYIFTFYLYFSYNFIMLSCFAAHLVIHYSHNFKIGTEHFLKSDYWSTVYRQVEFVHLRHTPKQLTRKYTFLTHCVYLSVRIDNNVSQVVTTEREGHSISKRNPMSI